MSAKCYSHLDIEWKCPYTVKYLLHRIFPLNIAQSSASENALSIATAEVHGSMDQTNEINSTANIIQLHQQNTRSPYSDTHPLSEYLTNYTMARYQIVKQIICQSFKN